MNVLLVAALLLLAPASSMASDFDEAHKNLSKAYGDFYKAAGKSSGSTADLKKLYREILVPASGKMDQGVRSAQVEALRNLRSRQVRARVAVRPMWGPDTKAGQESPAAPPASARNPVAPSKPKVVLDGSNIPREVEFSGAKRAAPDPSH